MAQRSAVSDVSFSLGLLRFQADLVPARAPGGATPTFSMLCTDCEAPTKVSQSYQCVHGHGPYVTGDLTRRGKELDGVVIEVTPEEIEAAKATDLPDKTFGITVFPAGPVEATTVADSGVYRVRPRKGATDQELRIYRMFLDAASNRDIALIGEFLLKGAPKMGRLGVFNGQLVVNTLVRPSDIADTDPIAEVSLSEKEQKLFESLLQAETELFDPDTFANTMKDRLNALIDAKKNGETVSALTAVVTNSPAKTDDLEALLMASLDAAA